MFGSSKGPYDRMVDKAQWEGLIKKLSGANTQTRVEIAAACGNSSEEDCINILIQLLKDRDAPVQLQAIKSLGMCGRSSAKTHLTWLRDRLPESSVEMRQAVKESLAKIGSR